MAITSATQTDHKIHLHAPTIIILFNHGNHGDHGHRHPATDCSDPAADASPCLVPGRLFGSRLESSLTRSSIEQKDLRHTIIINRWPMITCPAAMFPLLQAS